MNKKAFPINKNHPSFNINSRIRQLVIHYTESDMSRALEELVGNKEGSGRQVSAHYLVNNEITDGYSNYIYQLVNEELRAWHAGVSYWQGDTDLNNSSIGIEIVNHNGNIYPYPEEQIEAVIFLAKRIVEQYEIEPFRVVGHSDIAPDRKVDPGKLFPWERLYQAGIGAWPSASYIKESEKLFIKLPDIKIIKESLYTYGYKLTTMTSEIDEEYVYAVKAFQRHFIQNKVDGEMSLSDFIVLHALISEYIHTS